MLALAYQLKIGMLFCLFDLEALAFKGIINYTPETFK